MNVDDAVVGAPPPPPPGTFEVVDVLLFLRLWFPFGLLLLLFLLLLDLFTLPMLMLLLQGILLPVLVDTSLPLVFMVVQLVVELRVKSSCAIEQSPVASCKLFSIVVISCMEEEEDVGCCV